MPGIKPHARGGVKTIEIFGWGCATHWDPGTLYMRFFPRKFFLENIRKMLQRSSEKGNQRPREWGQKCGTMPNFIPWGLGMSPCNMG